MNTGGEEINAVTERVIGCAMAASNRLGCGFLEKPYENATLHLLGKQGHVVDRQVPIEIWFDGIVVADLVVEGCVLLEPKAANDLDDVQSAKCINSLRATGFPICLLLRFDNPRLQIKRFRGRPPI